MIITGSKKIASLFESAYVIDKNKCLDEAVCTHIDMNCCIIDNTAFLPYGSAIKNLLASNGYNICEINEVLSKHYPYDVPLNCKSFGNTVILNKKTVSKDILNYCENKNKRIIDVPQGYAGCSTLMLSENAIITADKGIYNETVKNSISSLLIKEGYIELKPYNYGFIGGASGFIGDTLYFFGDITKHADYRKIDCFLAENKIKYKYFDFPLTDIGGIIEI